MSITELIAIISILCTGAPQTSNTNYNYDDIKERRLACFDKYNNCAVKDGGKIITLKEFQNQCLNK